MLNDKKHEEINDRAYRIGHLSEFMEENLEIIETKNPLPILERLYTIRYYIGEEAKAIKELSVY